MYRISPSARLSRVGWNHVVKVLMLTRALTWSRNWSQGFPASRSRPTWVAVVIAKDKTKPLGYFHRMCKTCGKQFLAYSSRSEERRVGKECRDWGASEISKK